MSKRDKLMQATSLAASYRTTEVLRESLQVQVSAMRALEDRTAKALYRSVVLTTSKARRLQPGAILHQFANLKTWNRNHPWHLRYTPLTAEVVSVPVTEHGRPDYQHLIVTEPNEKPHMRRQYKVPIHWFCDPDLYEQLLAQGIDVSAYNLAVKGKE